MRRPLPTLLLLLLAGCVVEDNSGPPPNAPTVPATPPKAAAAPAPTEKEAAASLVDKAKKAAESGDLPASAQFLDRALVADPKNREALLLSATVTEALAQQYPRPHSSPLFLKAAAAMRTLRATYPGLTDSEKIVLPIALYNEACTQALNGENARAIKTLSEAFDAGFDNLGQVDMDDEFDSLRKLPEFRQLQERMERENAAKLLAAAKPFAFDFKLPDLDGKPVALADLKGKVTIVDFWGTWCVPCRKEIPHLIALYKKYHDKGLEIVGLNYEKEQGPSVLQGVRQAVKQNGIPYPCLIGDEATSRRVPDFDAFPTTLFLDGEGKVRLRLTGYQPLGALEAVIEAMLSGTKKDAPTAKADPAAKK